MLSRRLIAAVVATMLLPGLLASVSPAAQRVVLLEEATSTT